MTRFQKNQFSRGEEADGCHRHGVKLQCRKLGAFTLPAWKEQSLASLLCIVIMSAEEAPAAAAAAAPAEETPVVAEGDAAAPAAPAEPVIPKKVGRPDENKKNAKLEAISRRQKEIQAEQVRVCAGEGVHLWSLG